MTLPIIPFIMIDLEQVFHGVEVFEGDAWAADYTETTKHLPKESQKGVVISALPISDISAFHLSNRNGIAYYVVNFENNKSFFPQGRSDCECMFRCKNVVEGGWLLLCELKYGLDKEPNNSQNALKAYQQLLDSWKLLEERGVINSRQCRSFLNISMPSHKAPPFDSFVVSQDERLRLKRKHNIIVLGVNEVVVVNKGILRAGA